MEKHATSQEYTASQEHHNRYTGVQKLTDNPFLNLYHIDALGRNGKKFDYYFASRNDEEHIKHKTHSMEAEGMAIYALEVSDRLRIALVRQYRYPLNDYIYELPAGLVEPGESAQEAAIREMREETGLKLTVYQGGNPDYRRPFFLAQGFSDESGTLIFGTVSGDIADQELEETEDIEVILADKQEVRRILHEERLTTRAAFMLMHFLHASVEEPFAFLQEEAE